MVLVSDLWMEGNSEVATAPRIETVLDASRDGRLNRTEYVFEYNPVNPLDD